MSRTVTSTLPASVCPVPIDNARSLSSTGIIASTALWIRFNKTCCSWNPVAPDGRQFRPKQGLYGNLILDQFGPDQSKRRFDGFVNIKALASWRRLFDLIADPLDNLGRPGRCR